MCRRARRWLAAADVALLYHTRLALRRLRRHSSLTPPTLYSRCAVFSVLPQAEASCVGAVPSAHSLRPFSLGCCPGPAPKVTGHSVAHVTFSILFHGVRRNSQHATPTLIPNETQLGGRNPGERDWQQRHHRSILPSPFCGPFDGPLGASINGPVGPGSACSTKISSSTWAYVPRVSRSSHVINKRPQTRFGPPEMS